MDLLEMLEKITDEVSIKTTGDVKWIVDTYNHLFGAGIDITDYSDG